MPTSRFLRISIAVLLAFSIAFIADQAAAEKWKWHGTNFVTERQTMDVGDEEGHMLIISKAQELYVLENTGDKWSSTSVSTMDINPKTGKMTLHGYGVTLDKDGDKTVRTHEGKMVGKDQWAGTFSYISGTGKFEGIKGKGTWVMYTMGQGHPSYLEVEADVEVPAK